MGILAQSQAQLNWPQQQKVPLRAGYNVFHDDKSGVMDFSSPINGRPIEAWPEGEGKRGWGLGTWGRGTWGFGAGMGFGWGRGLWGLGRWGFSVALMTYVTVPLTDGTWTFAVVGTDRGGNPTTPASGTEDTVDLAGTPRAPGRPTADSYDTGTDELTVSFALSRDDEAA